MANDILISKASQDNVSKTVAKSYKMLPVHLEMLKTNAIYFAKHNQTEFLRYAIELGNKEIQKLVAKGKIKPVELKKG